ncbi:MAG: hypothetical protein JWQ23_3571 [Herminiimonas sp.]|nr:hypothetical protein [Herminiimonas sp.]
MSKTLITLLSVLLLAPPLANAASITMRPGLWELTTASDLLKLVPHIPPDQMQQLMNLARKNGFDLPEIQNGAAASKVCITPEMAAKNVPPHIYHQESGCTAKNETRTENRYRTDVVCAGPNVKGNGRAEGMLTSPESLSGRSEFTGTVQGTPINERAEISGRWIGASCGSVKPLQ